MKAAGYSVTVGPTLKDDKLLTTANLREAVEDGYGLIITSGGVGAENKDCTIEAILALDPDPSTPYICKYQIGKGRHHKDGVKIGVGKVSGTLIIALPGSNDEVKARLDVLMEGLKGNSDKSNLAENIAQSLRERLLEKNDEKAC
jgi:molybdopterin biosynthesis enzyme MoaB